MVEKGVDAAVVTALYEGALNNSYDVALLLSNDGDHTPAIKTIQDRLNNQIVHIGFRRGGSDVRSATWSHILPCFAGTLKRFRRDSFPCEFSA